jgi:hypothetical protein
MIDAILFVGAITIILGILTLLDWLGRRKERRSNQPKTRP